MSRRVIAQLSALVLVGCSQLYADEASVKPITNFEECVSAGNKVLRTYPGRCVTPDGKTFVQEVRGTSQKLCVDQCGNGTCEEMVCMGEGCPCPESASTCADCK